MTEAEQQKIISDSLDAVNAAVQKVVDDFHGAAGLSATNSSETGWIGSTLHVLTFGAYDPKQGTGQNQNVDATLTLQSQERSWIDRAKTSMTDDELQAWVAQGNQIIQAAKALDASVNANFENEGAFAKTLYYTADYLQPDHDPSLDDPANKPPIPPEFGQTARMAAKIAAGATVSYIGLKLILKLRRKTNPRKRKRSKVWRLA